MTLRHIIFGVVAAFLWLFFFTVGLVVPAQEALLVLNLDEVPSVTELATRLLIVMTCWTITNIGFLTCFAAYVGELSRFIRVSGIERPSDTTPLKISFGRAVVRGFFIYVLVMVGLVVTTTESMLQPTQETYFRLAGVMSLTGFVIGYYPELFARFAKRVVASLEDEMATGPNGHED